MTNAQLLDLILVVALVAAAIGGARTGVWSRLFGWLGVGIALVVGARFVPDVVTAFGGTSPDRRVSAAVVFLVVVAWAGHGLGVALSGVGSRRHALDVTAEEPADATGRARRSRRRSPMARLAGAACGVLGVLVLVWMLTPAVASTPGWPARAMRDSVVVAAVDRLAPEQPASFAAWGRLVAEAPYPPALDLLDRPPEAGEPPGSGLSSAVVEAVRPALVHVSGRACGRVQDGSGFAAATDERGDAIVVTNAHVVAGNEGTVVITEDGRERDARVIGFDAARDIAVLAIAGWSPRPLTVADEVAIGTVGSVLGFPGGGPLREAPALVARRIRAVGTDIYRRDRSERDVLVLAARLEPGQSGSPFVTSEGQVGGVAFAVDPGEAATAFALTTDEIRRALDALGPGAVTDAPGVGTGPCVRG